jgi:predicted O-methyltransferase YrrM
MKGILARKTIFTSLTAYKRLLRRKGYGIHSPFVYSIATKVIAERCPFYCFGEIEQLRDKFLADATRAPHSSSSRRKRLNTIARIVAHEGIRPRKGELLFRLVNYLKPATVLQVGSTVGFSTLYLSSYRPDVKCVSIEKHAEYAAISSRVYAGVRNSIEHHVGEYELLLPAVLDKIGEVDFVFFNTWRETNNRWLFNSCLSYKGKHSVFVFEGISRNRDMRKFWKYICSHPDVSTTLDLFTMGIVFFDPNLSKRNYSIFF